MGTLLVYSRTLDLPNPFGSTVAQGFLAARAEQIICQFGATVRSSTSRGSSNSPNPVSEWALPASENKHGDPRVEWSYHGLPSSSAENWAEAKSLFDRALDISMRLQSAVRPASMSDAARESLSSSWRRALLLMGHGGVCIGESSSDRSKWEARERAFVTHVLLARLCFKSHPRF